MKFDVKYLVFCTQALISFWILFLSIPASESDPTSRALSLLILGYWFPSPIGLVKERDEQ
jgi:hypothetical protein